MTVSTKPEHYRHHESGLYGRTVALDCTGVPKKAASAFKLTGAHKASDAGILQEVAGGSNAISTATFSSSIL